MMTNVYSAAYPDQSNMGYSPFNQSAYLNSLGQQQASAMSGIGQSYNTTGTLGFGKEQKKVTMFGFTFY